MFLSIKILTIRFDLFLGPRQKKKNGKGMVDRSFFTARKEIIIPPPPSLAPRLLQAWEAGRPFSFLLLERWPALSGGRGRSVGLQLESETQSGYVVFFLGARGHLEPESLCND